MGHRHHGHAGYYLALFALLLSASTTIITSADCQESVAAKPLPIPILAASVDLSEQRTTYSVPFLLSEPPPVPTSCGACTGLDWDKSLNKGFFKADPWPGACDKLRSLASCPCVCLTSTRSIKASDVQQIEDSCRSEDPNSPIASITMPGQACGSTGTKCPDTVTWNPLIWNAPESTKAKEKKMCNSCMKNTDRGSNGGTLYDDQCKPGEHYCCDQQKRYYGAGGCRPGEAKITCEKPPKR